MTSLTKNLSAFLDATAATALITVAEARGSTPREKGAWMLVSKDRIFGTIGGGQLEFLAIAKARELIAENISTGTMDIPLGPDIGQCCGGRVSLDIRMAGQREREDLARRAEAEDACRAHVYLFGGGHVGQALASALALLPVRAILVETRSEAVEHLPEGVESRLTPVPEQAVREAPAGAAFIVLTHDHALDFLIVSEALARDDAAYVGMIGSRTKKATFKNWYLKNGGTPQRLQRLITPIGGGAVHDKRPAIIAALVAAEVVEALSREG